MAELARSVGLGLAAQGKVTDVVAWADEAQLRAAFGFLLVLRLLVVARSLGTRPVTRDPSSRWDRMVLAAGLGGAYAAFAATFRGPRERFWQRMTATGLSLGALALATEPDLRRVRPRPRDLALGLGSAAGLYVVFQVGDRLARRILPKAGEEIDAIYGLRSLRPRGEIAARLVTVIAPAEELFWRGFVNGRLGRSLGRSPGAVLGSALYGGAHVVTGNLTLTGAASTAGAYWSALHAAGLSFPALVVSHIAWDVWTFLIAPTSRPAAAV